MIHMPRFTLTITESEAAGGDWADVGAREREMLRFCIAELREWVLELAAEAL